MRSEATPDFRLRFLGGCEIVGPTGVVRLESAKTTAVLVRLALADRPEPRTRLVALLWPELPEERATANLRRAIWDLRRRLVTADGTPLVTASRAALTLGPTARYELDVSRLTTALATARAAGHGSAAAIEALRQAAELYRGELLAGFACDGAPELEEWLLLEREALARQMLEGLADLVGALRASGEPREALAWARRAVALDPWRESAHQAVIEILAATGERGAALAQYEVLRRVLAEELQAEPSGDLVALAERLRHELPATGRTAPLPQVNTLPAQATPFVGRRTELDEVVARLVDPGCRLLSLVGPGGIGKTRLAVQAAQRLLAEAPTAAAAADGVAFVPPLPGGHPGRLAATLAAALGLAPAAEIGPGDARRRLLDALRERRLLLVVDGAEHLGGDRELLTELLAAAPEIAVLTTTRERLHLPGEWVVEVGGLSFEGLAARAQRPDASELFLQAARRATVGFSPDAQELVQIDHICRRLGGSPLAIELAAGWLGPYELAELEQELERDLSLLAVPSLGGQWSLAAVFDASFERLGEDERQALLAVSVCSGGMTRGMAEAVAAVGARCLAVLADRSFLRREPSGRLAMHEVLHHFARRRLALDPELERAATERHARAVAGLGVRLASDPRGTGRRAARDALAVELGNLRAAWRYAVSRHDAALLERLLDAVAGACDLGGRFEEGERLLGAAVQATEAGLLRGRILVTRAGFLTRLARYPEAELDARAALALAGAGNHPATAAWARFQLADVAYHSGRFSAAQAALDALAATTEVVADQLLAAVVSSRRGRVALEVGRLDEAERAFLAARDAATAAGLESTVAAATAQLGHVAYFRGDLDCAGESFAAALAMARTLRDTAATVQALHGLAYIAEDQGRLDQAAVLYHEGLALCRADGDRRGVAYSLMLLGENARRQRRFDVAREQSEAALEVARGIDGRYLVGLLLGNLAYVEAEGGELAAAWRRVRETLLAYRESGSFTVALPALVAAAQIRHREGRPLDAVALLGLVATHPANRQDHQLEIDRVAAPIRSELGADAFELTMGRGTGLDLEHAVAGLLEAPAR